MGWGREGRVGQVREHASGGERGNRSEANGSPIKNGFSYLDPAVLHADQSSTNQGTNALCHG
jgi:hypothetical protein